MVQLEPVRPLTVFQAVFDQLSALLSSDAFAHGDRLPSERDLAEQLQVSRPSVREALKALRVLGLVEVRGRTSYVKASRTQEEPASPIPLAEAELLEIHGFREAVELHIAGRAAERAAVEDADALDRVLATMLRAFARDVETFLTAETDFHAALARAAGNRLLIESYAPIREHDALQTHRLEAAHQDGAVADSMEHTLEAHLRIFEAVRQRDGSKARRLMRQHLAQIRQYVILGALEPPASDGHVGAIVHVDRS